MLPILAHGFVIMPFAYTFGNDGCSYINPALAIAAVGAGGHSALDAVPVIIAQILGGIVGAILLGIVYGTNAPHHLGAILINLNRTTLLGGFVLEAIGTFFVANIVLNTAIRGTAGRFAPFAIGMTVALCIMGFGAITGASLNPARTLGPAVASGDFSEVGLYLSAQITAAVIVALLYRAVWKEDDDRSKSGSVEAA